MIIVIGQNVLAVYPGSTVFYRARILKLPKVAYNEGLNRFIHLEFLSDELGLNEKIKKINANRIVPYDAKMFQ
jgi:hypothetical protein